MIPCALFFVERALYTGRMARMLDFRERTKLRRALYAKPTIIILAIFVLFAGHGAWAMYQKSEEAVVKRDKAQEDLRTLLSRNDELNHDIDRLSSDRGQEAAIRDRFMVAKDGEKVIIVSSPVPEKVHTVTIVDDSPTWQQKIKSTFGISGQ